MSPDEAFRLLELSADCGQSDVTKSFHELSRRYHPDTGDGDGNKQALLNEAREVATAAIADRKTLIPLQLQQTVREFEQSLAAERAARQATEFTASVKRKRVRPLQRLKYAALIVAAAAAAIGWFGENLLPDTLKIVLSDFLHLPSNISPDQDPIREGFKKAAIWLGALAGVLQFFVQRNSYLIESYTELLSDPETCAFELAAALEYGNSKEVKASDIAVKPRDIEDPFLKFLARRSDIDPEDRRRLLLLKAVEHGLLQSVDPKNVTSAYNRTYKVVFVPADFRPKEVPPKSPPPPMTEGEAFIGMMLTSILFSAIFALTWFLYMRGTWWMYVTGFFGLVSLVWVIIFEIEWLRARKRERKKKKINS
jgi:hypothetical protein